MQMMVELKILLKVPRLILAVIFSRLLEPWELCLFTRALLRAPLVHSNFNLNSASCTIVEIKT